MSGAPDDNFDNECKKAIETVIASCDFTEERKVESTTSAKITRQEVEGALARVRPFKTPGPDLIHPLFLKNGGFQVIKTLTVMFNVSFILGKLPYMWRVAYITPIPKKPGSLISFFRPISILSIPGKLFG